MSERDEAEMRKWEAVALLYMPPGKHHSLATELRLAAKNAREEEREEIAKSVDVRILGGYVARLFVGDYGVASWNAESEVAHTSATGKEYAEECARVLRKAIRQRGAKAGT